jgi:hypothetical protein
VENLVKLYEEKFNTNRLSLSTTSEIKINKSALKKKHISAICAKFSYTPFSVRFPLIYVFLSTNGFAAINH